MKLPPTSRVYFILLSTTILVSSFSNCEQLSTVFVLETSDSNESSPAALVANDNLESSRNKTITPESPNTHIITDDNPTINGHSSTGDGSSSINSGDERPQNDDYKPSTGPESVSINNQQVNQSQNKQLQQSGQLRSTNGSSNIAIRDTSTSTARRIEDESPPQTQARLKVGNNQNKPSSNTQQQQAATNQQRTRSTTTTTTTQSSNDRDYSNNNQQGTTLKTEDRLLISIVSDDEDYRPPQKQMIGSNGGGGGGGGISSSVSSDELRPPQQQGPKRKPSITISIQDANVNKQNGGSGQSVIVRPSENGQSIVISTIGGATLDTGHLTNSNNNQNNKYNQNKPVVATSPPPYREPIEIPIQNGNHHQIIHQTHTSTTTYRPSLVNNNNNNDYIPPNSNRPITSTLVEQSRPPINIGGSSGDERPQRPVPINAEDSYEGQQRPTSRPVNRPVISQQDQSSSSGFGTSGPIDNDEIIRPNGNDNTNNPQSQESSKYPLNERNCGLVHETKIVGGEEVDPDDFLWMAAIVKSRPSNGEARPFCGGSLITRRHILTAAHCLENLAPRDVLVRLGSYDFDDSTASSLSMDYAIDQFRVPAQYSKKTHVADIAIMRLKTPLSTTDNYKTVCMPQPRRSYVGALGTVTGYGSQSQTFRKAAPKLRQVTVPIWENRKCSVVYKKNLTESFLCAGYEEGGKDACQGDSGGPLMTEGPNERMMVVGVVSHGIGCGSPGYPGVYTRTTTFLDWIEKNTRE